MKVIILSDIITIREDTMGNKVIIFFMLLLVLSSCSMTIKKEIDFLRPSKISVPHNVEKIYLLYAGEYMDDLSLLFAKSIKESDFLNRYKISNADIGNVLSRSALYKIIDISEHERALIRSTTGVEGLVVAAVSNAKERTDPGFIAANVQRRIVTYSPYYGGRHVTYVNDIVNVPSYIRTYSFDVDIKFYDLTNSSLLYSKVTKYAYRFEMYERPVNFVSISSTNAELVSSFPTISDLVRGNAISSIDEFIKSVAPYTDNMLIKFETIPNDPLELNREMTGLIKNELYGKALDLLLKNIDDINGIENRKTRSIYYFNISMLYEVIGDLDSAYKYCKLSLDDDPTKDHAKGLKTLENRLKEHRVLEKQLN